MSTRLEAFLLNKYRIALEDDLVKSIRITLHEDGLAPWVAYIRYSIGEDHNDEPSVFFYIVLKSKIGLNQARSIERSLKLNAFENTPFYPYFNYRTLEECQSMKNLEPEWQENP